MNKFNVLTDVTVKDSLQSRYKDWLASQSRKTKHRINCGKADHNCEQLARCKPYWKPTWSQIASETPLARIASENLCDRRNLKLKLLSVQHGDREIMSLIIKLQVVWLGEVRWGRFSRLWWTGSWIRSLMQDRNLDRELGSDGLKWTELALWHILLWNSLHLGLKAVTAITATLYVGGVWCWYIHAYTHTYIPTYLHA